MRDYKSRLEASIAGLINREIERKYSLNHKKDIPQKNLLRRASENGIEHQPPVYEIINERIRETGDPELTPKKHIYLLRDMNTLMNFIKESLERDDYSSAKQYSTHMAQDCDIMLKYAPNKDYEKMRNVAIDVQKKSDTMLKNPKNGLKIIKMEIEIKRALAAEDYEKAAKLRDCIKELKS